MRRKNHISFLRSRLPLAYLSACLLIALGTVPRAWAHYPVNTCDDVIGGPASATYLPNYSLSYDFNGNLHERFVVSGSPSPLRGSVTEISNTLLIDTGEMIARPGSLKTGSSGLTKVSFLPCKWQSIRVRLAPSWAR
jgi:hypothetical protein